MTEKFIRIIAYTALTIAVITGLGLIVAGNLMEGWSGVAVMLSGVGIFITLLYMYNRRYR